MLSANLVRGDRGGYSRIGPPSLSAGITQTSPAENSLQDAEYKLPLGCNLLPALYTLYINISFDVAPLRGDIYVPADLPL